MIRGIFPTTGLILVPNISLLEIPLNQSIIPCKAASSPKKFNTLSLYRSFSQQLFIEYILCSRGQGK